MTVMIVDKYVVGWGDVEQVVIEGRQVWVVVRDTVEGIDSVGTTTMLPLLGGSARDLGRFISLVRALRRNVDAKRLCRAMLPPVLRGRYKINEDDYYLVSISSNDGVVVKQRFYTTTAGAQKRPSRAVWAVVWRQERLSSLDYQPRHDDIVMFAHRFVYPGGLP